MILMSWHAARRAAEMGVDDVEITKALTAPQVTYPKCSRASAWDDIRLGADRRAGRCRRDGTDRPLARTGSSMSSRAAQPHDAHTRARLRRPPLT
jgi:hypothetical protein